MNSTPQSLFEALPDLFRRRGGSVLESLLRKVDLGWECLARPWPPQILPDGSDLDGLDKWARTQGWGHIVDEIGMARVQHPDRLLQVHQCRHFDTESLLRYWLDCLFGIQLLQCEHGRDVRADLPPHYRVRIAKTTQDKERKIVVRVVRHLLPAHCTFSIDGLDRVTRSMESAE